MFGFIQKIIASVGLLVASIFGFNQAPEITPTPKPIPVVETTQSPSPLPTPNPIIKYIVITPTPTPIPVYVPISTLIQDSSLKIAKCQAQAREEVNNALNEAILKFKPLFQQQLDEAHAGWVAAKREQIAKGSTIPESLIGAPPSIQESVRESAYNAVQPTVDYYANLEQQIIDNWQKAKQEVHRITEQQFNSLYLGCLNQ